MGCGESHVVPPSLPENVNVSSSSTVSDIKKYHNGEEKSVFLVSRRKNGEDEKQPDSNKSKSKEAQNGQINGDNRDFEVGDGDEPPGALDEDLTEDFEGEFDFITEKSAPDLVAKVLREFQAPNGIELIIVGRKCPRLISAVQRTKQEEAMILESLRNEGLIARPLKQSQNATGFEIIEENADKKTKFIPAALLREERPEKQVTSDSILEKLAKAEERRKQQEEEKKSRAVTAKPRVNIQARREDEMEELRNQQLEKWEAGLRNRELQLLEKQEKLKEKHQRIKGLHFKKSFRGSDPFDDDD